MRSVENVLPDHNEISVATFEITDLPEAKYQLRSIIGYDMDNFECCCLIGKCSRPVNL